MAHMVTCLFEGGPLDLQILDVSDQVDTLNYGADLRPVPPPIEQDGLHNTVMQRHVYVRKDPMGFTYKGYY